MMCAHHPPAGGASLDLPAGQHLSEKILDGGPAILEAVLYLLGTPLARVRYWREIR